MRHRAENPGWQVRCTVLSSEYAANAKPDAPRGDVAYDVADDAIRVVLPDEPPPLTPEAARALLRLLLSIERWHTA
jgi:hypothetical protein